MPENDEPERAANGNGATGAGPRQRMERALGEVRREVRKAALVYAVVDAVAAFLAANLLFSLVGPPFESNAAVLAVPVGVAVLGGELWVRLRRPEAERFEAVNPSVAEALRTARDAVTGGADSRMAARLYEDVLERLRGTSGVALVDTRRVAATLLVVVALSLASIQVAVVDLSLLGGEPGVEPDDGDGPTEQDPSEFSGLRDGDSVLGAAEDVDRGEENLTARIDATDDDGRVEDDRQFPPPSDGGGDTDGGAIESQQAGYAPREELEDAELVREYNLRIREGEE